MLRGKDHFDLLFTDDVMPGDLCRSELVRQARALRPGLKVLLPKPCRLTDLAAKVQELRRG